MPSQLFGPNGDPVDVDDFDELAIIGGSPFNFFTDPKIGKQANTGHPQIDAVLSALLQRQDALARELVAVRKRLSAVDGEPIPQPPPPEE